MSTWLYRKTDEVQHAGVTTETFNSSPHVGSPWDATMQHGGPVAALLVRAMDRCQPRPGTRIARVSVDLLGPVPLRDVTVSARVVRPGRRIELISAELAAATADGDWRPVARAAAWRLATQATEDVVNHADASRSLPVPESGDFHSFELPEQWRTEGFVESLTWRIEDSRQSSDTATMAWIQLEKSLVDAEITTPLEAVMAIADTANGIGARLDPAHFTFLNCDLIVSLHTAPVGDWFGLVAETSVGPDGVAMSSAVLHDHGGPIGRVSQTVLVERLPG